MRAKLAGVCLFAAALALATWAPAQEATPTTITDIRQESTGRSTRLVVECTGPLAYTYYSPDPLTLVVDIPEVDASQVPARVNVGTREVESLRVTSLARADGRSLARVDEECWCAGRRKGCGDLLADVAALADAGDDHPPPGRRQQSHRLGEGVGK